MSVLNPSAAKLPNAARALHEAGIANLQQRLEQAAPAEPDNSAEAGRKAAKEHAHQERERLSARVDAIVRREVGNKTAGFENFGDFLLAVRAGSSALGKAKLDPRLRILNTTSVEGIGQDGGFAVPADFSAAISAKILADDSLLRMTDLRNTTSNVFTFPKDEATPWQASGGVQTYWENEAGQFTQSKTQLKSGEIRLSKLIAFVPVTDEVLEDASALESHIAVAAPSKISFALENAIINGNGAGRPLGVLNSGATITAAALSGQTAGTILSQNVSGMWKRLLASARKRAIWVAHPDCDEQLQQLVFPGAAGNVALSAPMYTPPSADAPNGRLLGRPIYLSEACAAPGTVGDLILMDPTGYATALQKIAQSVSIHVFFDYDVTCFRFVLRVGGQPWATSTFASLNGSVTKSFAVALATR